MIGLFKLTAGVAATSTLLLGVQTVRLAGAEKQVVTVTRERTAARADRDAWKAAYGRSEALRARETAGARTAVSEAEAACVARVEAARTSARAIREIVAEKVKTDAKGCPVRGVVGADRLRDALAPARR